MEQRDRAYLSILGWPRGFDLDRRVEGLVVAAGMDPYLASQMARRETPAIVHQFDLVLREEILGALHGMGVLALAPSRAEMRAYGRAEVAREVERFPGAEPAAFAVQQRDGGAWTFQLSDVRLVVIGTVRQVGRVRTHGGGAYDFGVGSAAIGGADMVLAEMAWDAINDEGSGGWGSHTTRSTRAVPTVDLHVMTAAGPRLVRLSGSTTRIGVVGEPRGRPSLLDRPDPGEEIARHMPGVCVDTGFERFNTPSDIEQMADSAGQGSARLNPIAFHFYSVWSALIDMGVRGW